MSRERLYGNPPDFVDQGVNFIVELFQGRGSISKLYLVTDTRNDRKKIYEIVARGRTLTAGESFMLSLFQVAVQRGSQGSISATTVPEEELGPFKTSWKRNKYKVVEIDLNIARIQDQIDSLVQFFSPTPEKKL